MDRINSSMVYPNDWEEKKLGELGVFLKGKGISKGDTKETGYPCVLYGEIYTRHHNYIKHFYSFIDEETANKSIEIKKGDILFAGSGETKEEIGKSVAYLDDSVAYAGGDIIILRTTDINSQYLAYTLNHGKLAIERAKLGQGHSVVHIYSKELANLSIKLPSKDEQQRIVSILSTWDKAIELKEKLIEQKKEQKKGLMQKLLTGEIRLSGYSEKWNNEKISKLSKVYRGASPRPIADPKWFDNNSKIGWVRISDVTKSEQVLLNTEQSLSEEGVKKSRLVKQNNIIMSICATVGKPIITGFDVCIHDGFVVFDNLKLNMDYFYYALLRIENNWAKYGQTGSQMNLNTDIVNSEKIMFPNDPSEQEAIVYILRSIDKEIDLIQKEFELMKLQKQALMQQLLTGKIRVKM